LDKLDLGNIAKLLEIKFRQYNQVSFIANDPICIPHKFNAQQDIEIAGFFAATLAWGLRKTIINNANNLMHLMDDSPYEFITKHEPSDLKRFLKFVHRTFNATDLLYFIHFLNHHYSIHKSLETAFINPDAKDSSLEDNLKYFYNYFFSLDHPLRTHKHVATPAKNSACKRLCMFLRWMVRQDNQGVDFGLWKQITPAQLICPMDVHVSRVSYQLGLIDQPKSNWKTALQLTDNLKKMDGQDPCKYDYALFALGVIEDFK
jgi:uncharacterized protein (TIGR02757 family)